MKVLELLMLLLGFVPLVNQRSESWLVCSSLGRLVCQIGKEWDIQLTVNHTNQVIHRLHEVVL